MTAGFTEFEFDLPDALLSSLILVFGSMAAAPLNAANVAPIPEAQGVYQLLLNGQIVYIGKTDAEAGLRRRLERHSRTILHRLNLDPAVVSFKAVRVFVFTAIDLEAQLIRHYGTSAPVPWNNSGFGSNDPGRDRDTTRLKEGGFDEQFPINLDHEISIDIAPGSSSFQVLKSLKQRLPYGLRVEGQLRGAGHPELSAAHIAASPAMPCSTRDVILAVLNSLPPGWQATALAGRVILYRENRAYQFGTLIGRSD